jgi:2-methylisocitrate lyase-like PEP mutase family enzyme
VNDAAPLSTGDKYMSADLIDKGNQFRALHAAAGTFLIANCWDGGSARVLTGLGFKALATSSGASAGTLGRLDGQVTREGASHATPGHAARDALDRR